MSVEDAIKAMVSGKSKEETEKAAEAIPVPTMHSIVKTVDRSATIDTKRVWKDGTVIVKEEDEEDIQVRTFCDVPVANVGFSCRMTLNLGDYETVQVAVNATVPCYVEEMAQAYEAAKEFVDSRLNKEVASIREYRSRKRKGE